MTTHRYLDIRLKRTDIRATIAVDGPPLFEITF